MTATDYSLLAVVVVGTTVLLAMVVHYEIAVRVRRQRYLERIVLPAQLAQRFDADRERVHGGAR